MHEIDVGLMFVIILNYKIIMNAGSFLVIVKKKKISESKLQ